MSAISVPVYLFALYVHGARAVYVGVENYAQIRVAAEHLFFERVYRNFTSGLGAWWGNVPSGSR